MTGRGRPYLAVAIAADEFKPNQNIVEIAAS